MYFVISIYIYIYIYICIKKNKWWLHTIYLKREVPQKVPKSLFWGTHLSQWRLHQGWAKLCIRLKWPNMYFCFCMVLRDIVVCLFIYVWWDVVFWCMIFCFLFWLFKSFPNYHSVCHPNNNACTPFNNFVVVVTMDHWSSLDSGTQWWTHQLIAQSH